METSMTGLQNFSIQYLVDRLQVTVAGKKNFSKIALLGFWLVFWLLIMGFLSFFIFAEFGSLLHDSTFLFLLILIGVLIIWQGVFRIVVGTYLFFWQLGGEEKTQISNHEIIIQRKIFGVGTTTKYDANQIRNVQVVDPIILPFAFTKIPGTTLRVIAQGPIAFKYNKATIRFGNGLDNDEAKEILTKVQERFPRYDYGDGTDKIDAPLYLKLWMFMYRY